MSILIKGMEMPKDKSAKIIIRTNGNAWLMSDGGKWLEVVEIPTPHGRLIDADAFVDYVQNRYDNNEITNGDWIGFRLAMKDQPTIVPEEGGPDNG